MGLSALAVFPLVYLATPYSKYAAGLEHAARDATILAARLAEAGIRTFSPIVYSHALAQRSNIPERNHEFWLWLDQPFMDASEALMVAHMAGWEESFGIGEEIKEFKRHRKPVFHLNPVTMELVDEPE